MSGYNFLKILYYLSEDLFFTFTNSVDPESSLFAKVTRLGVSRIQRGFYLLGKGWPLGSLVYDASLFLSLSHVVSWVRCCT